MGRRREPLTKIRKRGSGLAANMVQPVFNKPAAENAGKTSTDEDLSDASGVCDPPDWLEEEARQQWRAIIPKIKHVINQVDVNVLGRYCTMMALYVKVQKELFDNATDTVYMESGNKRVIKPEFKMIEVLQKQLSTVEAVFGMNPSARSTLRLYIPKDARGDEVKAQKKEIKDFRRVQNQ